MAYNNNRNFNRTNNNNRNNNKASYTKAVTVAYEDIVIVAQEGIALVMSANSDNIVAESETSFCAILKAMAEVLETIPTNDEIVNEPARIVLCNDIAKAFATGSYIDYLRTNSFSSGKPFTEEESNLILEVAQLMGARTFNVRVVENQFVSKNDKDTKELVNQAWDEVKALVLAKHSKNKPAKPQRPTANKPVAPEKPNHIVALENAMAKALEECDFDKYDKLEERYNKAMAQLAPKATDDNEVVVNTNEEEPAGERDIIGECADLEI